MSRRDRVEQLQNYLEEQQVDVHPAGEWGMEACDLRLHWSDRLAFLRVVAQDEPTDLVAVWLAAQREIARKRDERFAGQFLPDFYLVLMTEATLPLADIRIQSILNDPYVCRKLLVEWANNRLSDLMPQLPFWRFDRAGTVAKVRTPAEVMALRGYHPTFVGELLQRTGAEAITQRLIERTLPISAPPPVRQVERAEPAERPVRQARRIARLEAEGFRPYKRAFPLELDAGLVAIWSRNGTGKTSLCEALEWGLTGEIGRVADPSDDAPEDAPKPVVNLLSDRASVKVQLRAGDNIRSIEREVGKDGADPVCQINGRQVNGIANSIVHALDAQSLEGASPNLLKNAFRRYHFLDQGTFMQFLLDDTPKRRYESLRLMLGTADFGQSLKKARLVVDQLRSRGNSLDKDVAGAMTAWQEAAKALDEASKTEDNRRAELQRLIAGQGVEDPERLLADTLARGTELGLLQAGVRTDPPAEALGALELLAGRVTPQLAAAELQIAAIVQLQQRLGSRAEFEGRRERSAKEAAQLKLERETLSEARTGRVSRIEQHMAAVERYRSDVSDSEARMRNLERYLELQQALASGRAEHDTLAAQSAAAQAARGQAEAAVGESLQTEAQQRKWEEEAAAAVADAQTRLDLLQRAQQALASWFEASARHTTLTAQLAEAEPRLQETSRRLEEASALEQKLAQEQSYLAKRIAELQQTLSERQRLLAALEPHIDDNHCPLCRWRWESIDALKQAVHDALALVPQPLAEAEARQAEVSRLQAGVKATAADLSTGHGKQLEGKADLEQQRGDLEQRLRDLVVTVRGALTDATLDAGLGDRLNELIAAQVETLNTRRAALESARSQFSQQTARLAPLRANVAVEQQRHAALLQSLQAVRGRLAQLEAEAGNLPLRPEERQDPAGALVVRQAEKAMLADALKDEERRVSEHSAALQETDRKLTSLEQREQAVVASLRATEEYLVDLRLRLEQLGLPSGAPADAVAERRIAANTRRQALQWLAGALPVASTYIRARQEQEETKLARAVADKAAKDLEPVQEQRRNLGHLQDLCQRFCDELREAGFQEERQRLAQYTDTVNLIYQRLSIHPLFGELVPQIDGNQETFQVQVRRRGGAPVGVPDYFSTAQMNIVILSLFITSALMQEWSSLRTIILDDPVQHMDDLNSYALLDLLRSLAERDWQVIVTTANIELYKLMLVKFSVLNREGPGFKGYRLRGITNEGPELIEDTHLVRH